MIPHLDTYLQMNKEGNFPMEMIVSYVVKHIANHGGKADFDALPDHLRREVAATIDWYKREGVWLVVSNTAMEDYSGYADAFIKKIEE